MIQIQKKEMMEKRRKDKICQTILEDLDLRLKASLGGKDLRSEVETLKKYEKKLQKL